MKPIGDGVDEHGVRYFPDYAGPGEHRVVFTKPLSAVLCF